MNKIDVSAAIVTHNNRDVILRTLGSILNNTNGVNLKLYIVDNVSTDDTVKIIKDNYPDIEIIENNKNMGFGAGHNTVLKNLNSKYHVIINPDILFNNDTISELAGYIDEHPEIGMITPRILNEDGSEQHLPKRRPKIKYLLGGRFERIGGVFKKWRTEYTMSDKIIDKPIDIYFSTGCFTLIRTELFKKIGGFDDRYFMYFEDADLTREVAKTHKAVFYPSVSVTHLWERASAKRLKFFIIQLSSMLKFFTKKQ